MRQSTATFRLAKSCRAVALIAGSWLLVGCGGGAPAVHNEGQANTLPADIAVPASSVPSPVLKQVSEAQPPLVEPASASNAADATHAALTLALFDADATVRIDAASELAGSESGVDLGRTMDLLATAATDSDEHVRASVVESLADLDRHALDGAPNKDVHAMLADALHDSQPAVREAAVETLVEMGGSESARLVGLALYDPDARVREEAVYALGHIGGSTSIELLRHAAADPDAELRRLAQEQLAKLAHTGDI